jgi:hypothetical protein
MAKEPNTVVSDTTPLVTQSATLQDPAWYWRNRPKAALRQLLTPAWRTRAETNLPLLATAASVDTPGPLDFPGAGPDGTMSTFAFETRPGSTVKYVGVTTVAGKLPTAFLIYFRHTVQDKDFHGDNTLLETGIGDYFVGRMQVCRQVLRSGKNIAVILPVAMGSAGEFAANAAFVEQCLADITQQLFSALTTRPPLLLACNSDGIRPMSDFLSNCRSFVPRIKAVYDFDGSLVLAARGVSLTGIGSARVFRYRQSGAPSGPGGNPRQVPLPYERWSRHFNFVPAWKTNLEDPKTAPSLRALAAKQVQGYLHHFIPTCMLHHGLVNTSDI